MTESVQKAQKQFSQGSLGTVGKGHWVNRQRAFLLLTLLNHLVRDKRLSHKVATPIVGKEMRKLLEERPELSQGHYSEDLAWLKQSVPQDKHMSTTFSAILNRPEVIKARYHSGVSRAKFFALFCCGSQILDLDKCFTEAESSALRKTELSEEEAKERLSEWASAGHAYLLQLGSQPAQVKDPGTQEQAVNTDAESVDEVAQTRTKWVEDKSRGVQAQGTDVNAELDDASSLSSPSESDLTVNVPSMRAPARNSQEDGEDTSQKGSRVRKSLRNSQKRRRSSGEEFQMTTTPWKRTQADRSDVEHASRNARNLDRHLSATGVVSGTAADRHRQAGSQVGSHSSINVLIEQLLAQSPNEFNVSSEDVMSALSNIKTTSFDVFTSLSRRLYPRLNDVLGRLDEEVITHMRSVASLLTGAHVQEACSTQVLLASLHGKHHQSPISMVLFFQTVFMAYLTDRVFKSELIFDMLSFKPMSSMGSTGIALQDYLYDKDPTMLQIFNKICRSFTSDFIQSESFQRDVSVLATSLAHQFLESLTILQSDASGQFRQLRDDLADIAIEAINLKCKLNLCSSKYEFVWPSINARFDPGRMSCHGRDSREAAETQEPLIRIASSPVVLCANPGNSNKMVAEAWAIPNFEKLRVIHKANVEL